MSTPSHYTLYVGSYAGADQPGVFAFTLETASGQLAPAWAFSGIVHPSFVIRHPNGRWLFAVSETSRHKEGRIGEVWALHVPDGSASEQPREINHQSSNGDWPCHLTIDASGRWLLVSNYQSGNVSVFPIQSDGALGAMAEHVQHHGHGPNPARQAGPHAHATIFTPDQRFVVVADLGLDQLVVYAFDATTGQLAEHARVRCQPGSGPRHMVFHPTGAQLYVSHELNNTVVVYAYDATDCTFAERQTITTIPAVQGENLAADIHLSSTGEQLYVSNRGNDSIAIYTIMPDGLLAQPTLFSCGGHWPRQFALTPDGNLLLVANQYSNDVTILPLTAHASALDGPRVRTSIPGASCIEVVAHM